ncbi:flagellar protein [Bacillus sp. V3-13]|uniref:TIGR02530 family flagellar biosynthesis protein n=1 Tax=Bacillus sp. V3-13 TaxID=2053728 RepID=UPI000C767EC5|nr:TIGR02530 family flagellar biosynthesis protein [Bacillus sp. V3-13]PLR77641.1 flagellar protein [Bacillus sp. V3-13]
MDKPVFRPIQSPAVTNHQYRNNKAKPVGQHSFSLHLHTAIGTEKLTMSKHASERLEQRNIRIDDQRWGRIEKKVQEAKRMGVKESLVLLKDAALIVSAKNNTVITAMDRDEASTQIFTNIDGTIILEN